MTSPTRAIAGWLDPRRPSGRRGFVVAIAACVALLVTVISSVEGAEAQIRPEDVTYVALATVTTFLLIVILKGLATARRLRDLALSPWLALAPPAAMATAGSFGETALFVVTLADVGLVLALASWPGRRAVTPPPA